MTFNSTSELIHAISQGEMVILLDDEDRENEGDFVMAAEHVKPQDINFMITHGRGLVCMPLSKELCHQLDLPLMVPNNNKSRYATNFTVSVEAAKGVTTGISAKDRACTFQAAIKPNAKPQDLIQPGHVFPLMAKDGGVLTRAGHTEACCDLVRLAGLKSAGALVEILKVDGDVARRDDLFEIAKQHQLKIGTIADLIKYRIEHETTIQIESSEALSTDYGTFKVSHVIDLIDQASHLVIQKGTVDASHPTYVRVHYQDPLADLVGACAYQKSWSMPEAMRFMQQVDCGLIVILMACDHDFSSKLKAASKQTYAPNIRTTGAGARILKAFGVQKMKVLSPPKKFHGLSGFDLDVVEYISEPCEYKEKIDE